MDLAPFAVRVDPGLAHPLLDPTPAAPDARTGADGPAAPSLAALLDVAERADLRGCGGSGFPFATKLRAVAAAAAPTGVAHVIANGAEGEPASVKDRYLLATRPDLVLDGLLLAAHALPAGRAILYVTEPELVAHLANAIAERAAGRVELVVGPATYVSGEESAVVRAIECGDARPTNKPPRPFEAGLGGRPTLISNVETLARLAREVCATRTGRAVEPTVLATVTPDVGRPTLMELPAGSTVRDALRTAGVPAPRTLLIGGFFGGFLPEALWDCPLEHQALRAVGSALGCAALMPIVDSCPVAVAAELLAFFDRENAGQCGACFNGTRAMAAAMARLSTGTAADGDLADLARWSSTLAGRGACGTLDAATIVAATTLRDHESLLAAHTDAACADCRHRPVNPDATRFDLSWPDLVKECA